MSLTNALKNRIKGVKKAVIGTTSDVLSAPARAYHGAKGARATREAGILRKARGYKGAADFDSKGDPTDALKYRTAADVIRSRRK